MVYGICVKYWIYVLNSLDLKVSGKMFYDEDDVKADY